MPSSIDMPLNENEKRWMKEHIHKSVAVSSKVVVQNKKNYLKDEWNICAAYNHSMAHLALCWAASLRLVLYALLYGCTQSFKYTG